MEPIIQCESCKHYNRGENNCKAFPNGVPTEILWGEIDEDNLRFINVHDHKTPYPGDNGIRFEPIEEKNGNKIN